MTTRRVRPSRLLASLVAAVALAGACGGGDDGDDPAPTDESQAEGPCALLTTDEVADLFDEDAEVTAPAGEGAATSTCLWEATGGEDDFPTRHQLQLSVFEGGGPLDPQSYGEDAEPIDDLGDEGFLVTEGTLGTTAGFRDGDRSLIVTYAIIGGEDAPRPSERADDVVELLRTAGGRVEGA